MLSGGPQLSSVRIVSVVDMDVEVAADNVNDRTSVSDEHLDHRCQLVVKRR